ncbi:MAG TPA: RluA family pseudouridine synthase [Candidatus Deferrimicrobiaceae bacterium]
MKTVELDVSGSGDGLRVDRFLRDSLPPLSTRSIRLALETGEVFSAGKTLSKGDRVRAGQKIVVRRLAEPSDWQPLPGDVEGASVLFQDGVVAVLDKPEGIPTEPLSILEAGTLAGFFRWRFPETQDWCLSTGTPLLSRLDFDTSGVVLAALTEPAWRELIRQREEAAIGKRYICVVDGMIAEPATLKGTIESRGGARVRVRPSIEEPSPVYWTRIFPLASDGRRTLAAAEILKGKRHQVRAHLAAAGHPIVGDTLYGKGERGRLMLHAAGVTFDHPVSAQRMTVTSSAPKGFEL